MDYIKAISDFAKLAREFCEWANKQPEEPEKELYSNALMLSKLYYYGLQLPEVQLEKDLPKDEYSVNDEEWKKVFKRFASLPFQYYREIFNPSIENNDDPVTGDICDDFADIYRDLKEGLRYYDLGKEELAVFTWRFTFGTHWGRHILSALRAIHAYEPEE
jgi:hypothetical protein